MRIVGPLNVSNTVCDKVKTTQECFPSPAATDPLWSEVTAYVRVLERKIEEPTEQLTDTTDTRTTWSLS